MLSKLYNTAKQGVGKLGDSLSGRFSKKQTFYNDMYLPDQTAQQPKIQELHQPEPQQYAQAKQPPLREHYQEPQPQDEDIFSRASRATQEQYGFAPSPEFLRAVNQQESSGLIDESDLNLYMGMTDTAKADLGENYLEPSSVDNVVQNSSNYLAKRARGFYDSGETYDWSTPGKEAEWYVRQYVGLKPGESRDMGGGQMVSYEDIVKMFERHLTNQQ